MHHHHPAINRIFILDEMPSISEGQIHTLPTILAQCLFHVQSGIRRHGPRDRKGTVTVDIYAPLGVDVGDLNNPLVPLSNWKVAVAFIQISKPVLIAHFS